MNAIYHDYIDFLEAASIDESYLDMTGGPEFYHLSPRELADNIRERVKREIGITISVGCPSTRCSPRWDRIKKPDATMVITEDNFREFLWLLPVSICCTRARHPWRRFPRNPSTPLVKLHTAKDVDS